MSLGAARIVPRTRAKLTILRAAESRHPFERGALRRRKILRADASTSQRASPFGAAGRGVACEDLCAPGVSLGGGTLGEVAAARRVAERLGQGDATDPPQNPKGPRADLGSLDRSIATRPSSCTVSKP